MSIPSLNFELDPKKTNKRGQLPVVARIVHFRKKAEKIVLKINLDEVHLWDHFKRRFKPNATPYYNKILSEWQNKFDKFLADNYFNLAEYDPLTIMNLFNTCRPQKKRETGLIEYLENYYQDILLKQYDLKAGATRNFRTSLNILNSYLQLRELSQMTLKEFDGIAFIKFYESMLDKNRLPKPMKINSAGSVVKKLRPAFNRALKMKLIQENPTYSVKLSNKNTQRCRLFE